MQNRIKEHPKYSSILNYPLKLMDAISHSMCEPVQAIYPYMPLTESISRMMNAKQNEKEGLLEYMERFKK